MEWLKCPLMKRSSAAAGLLVLLSFAISIVGCAGNDRAAARARAREEAARPPPPHLRFEFHGALLMNLHHFLHDAARHPDRLEHAEWAATPTAQDMAGLRAAVAFYAQRFGKKDLPVDAELTGIDHALGAGDDTLAAADGLALPPELIAELDRAAPIYARVLWPVHRQADQLWINNVSTLNARYGDEIQARLEHALSRKFPAVIRVDLVYETALSQGGYTDGHPPQSVLPSSRASHNGEASLEMLWHEATARRRPRGAGRGHRPRDQDAHRAPADQLSSAAQFYTVGYVVTEVYQQQARIDYVPYATKNDVYTHTWPTYFALLDSDWRAWLQGRGTMQQAVRKMVERLPPA